jgi:hypothetical protein
VDKALRFVGTDNVPDHGPAEGTVSSSFAPPLLQRAFVAHTHVSAHIQDGVDRILVAYRAFGAGAHRGTVLFGPSQRRRVRTRVRYGLKQNKCLLLITASLKGDTNEFQKEN